MNDAISNSNSHTKHCQDSKAENPPEKPAEGWQDYKARIWAKCHQTSPTNPDDTPPTLNDMATAILSGFFYDGRPPEYWTDWLKEALLAQPNIAKLLQSIDSGQPDYTDLLQRIADGIDRLAEAVKENNRLLRGGRDANSR